MNNPADGIPPQLLRHLHLVSNHKYALLPKPNMELIVRYLSEAPKIVRDLSTMSWTALLEPPRDGTLFLVWQPPQMGTHFASDCYLWADAEQAFSQQMRGFNLEIYVHSSGLKPRVDPVATHARRRYRLVPNPGESASQQNIDSSLWLIHYFQAEPTHHIPAQNVPVSEAVRQSFAERQVLHNQGQLQLQHKEFMLRDRDNWPTLPATGPMFQQQGGPGGYQGNMMAQMAGRNPQAAAAAAAAMGQRPPHPGQFQQQQQQQLQQQQPGPAGPSPAKKARRSSAVNQQYTSATAIPKPPPSLQAIIDEEENAAGVDYIDMLNPQQVSRQRYAQHHEWLEEILDSPYDSHRIIPSELGLGRKGELESLTRDFFHAYTEISSGAELDFPPTRQGADGDGSNGAIAFGKDQPNPRVGRLQDDKAAKFTELAAQRIQAMRAEMDEMSKSHAQRMDKFSRIEEWKRAEQAVRQATPVKLSVLDGAADGENESDDKLAPTLAEVERKTGKVIKSIKQMECLEKGGLEEGRPQTVVADPDLFEPKPEVEVADQVMGQEATAANAAPSGESTTGSIPQPSAPETASADQTGDDWVVVDKTEGEKDAEGGAATDAAQLAVTQDNPAQPSAGAMDLDTAPAKPADPLPATTATASSSQPATTDTTSAAAAADTDFVSGGGGGGGTDEFEGAMDFGDFDTAGEALAGYGDESGDMATDIAAESAVKGDPAADAPSGADAGATDGSAPAAAAAAEMRLR